MTAFCPNLLEPGAGRISSLPAPETRGASRQPGPHRSTPQVLSTGVKVLMCSALAPEQTSRGSHNTAPSPQVQRPVSDPRPSRQPCKRGQQVRPGHRLASWRWRLADLHSAPAELKKEPGSEEGFSEDATLTPAPSSCCPVEGPSPTRGSVQRPALPVRTAVQPEPRHRHGACHNVILGLGAQDPRSPGLGRGPGPRATASSRLHTVPGERRWRTESGAQALAPGTALAL